MGPKDDASLRFDAFRFDPARGVLFGADNAELRLRPKALALLQHLLGNPGRLLGRRDLLEVMWPGIAVTDDSLTQCVSDLRHAFGKRARYVLRTVPKRGYMLISEVRHDTAVPPPGLADTPPPLPVPSLSRDIAALRRETITVQRFTPSAADPACVPFAEGLTSDLVAALTCLEGLRVQPGSTPRSGEGYQVRGEVRAIGDTFRVTVRLEEPETGIALWAERFSTRRDGLSELPASDLTTLVVHLGQQVDRHCLSVARHKAVGALSARELHLIGRDHHQRGTEADTAVAKQMFALAMARDPEYAHAYAWQTYTVARAVTHGWGSPGAQAARDEALRLARCAVRIDPTSPLCLSCLAFTLMLHQHWDDAVATARATLQSDRPAFTAARNPCCEVLTQAGYPEEAVAIARGTLVLDPFCSPITHALLGRALLLLGQAEEAVEALRWCTSRLPDYAPAFDSLVAAAWESGRTLEAASAWREVRRLRCGWTPRNHTGLWHFRHPGELRRFEAAYRQAAELAGPPLDEPANASPVLQSLE